MLGSADRFVEGYVLGMWQANCFIVGDRSLGKAVVVDPGQDATETVTQRLDDLGVTCDGILLTHGHLDHLWSAPELADKLDAPVFLHADDRYLWDEPAEAFGNIPPGAREAQFGLRWEPPNERLETLQDEMTLTLAGLRIQTRHTPGHTPGSSVFLLTDTGED